MNISDMVKEAYETAKSKGWHETRRSIPELLCLIHSEVTEALDDYRNNLPLDQIYWEGTKPCGFTTELADVIIRIADLCGAFDLDLEKAIELKMAANKLRSHRHGGKAC